MTKLEQLQQTAKELLEEIEKLKAEEPKKYEIEYKNGYIICSGFYEYDEDINDGWSASVEDGLVRHTKEGAEMSLKGEYEL
jgi:hypothetical protein